MPRTAQLSPDASRAMVEHAVLGMLVHRDFQPLYANDALLQSFGLASWDELVELGSVLALADPEEQERLRALKEARVEGVAVPEQYEARMRRKDGSRFWARLTSRIVPWDGGPAILATYEDITAEREAQAALRASMESYQLVMEQATDAMFVLSAEGGFVMVNAASTELTGYSKDEFEHLTIAHLVSEEEQEEASAVLAALEVDEVHQREWRMRTKQGGMRTVEVAVRRRSDGLVQGIARDVTEYRAEFRELVEHNDLLRRVFDALPVWVSVKDAAGHYYLYNQAGQELTATVDTPLEQRTFADLSVGTPEEVAAVEALDRQVLETQAATLPTELNLTLQDGTVHNLLVTKVPLLDQDGGIDSIVTTTLDVTDLKQAEAALRESDARLRLLTDAVPVLISYVDDSLVYRFSNRLHQEWIGGGTTEVTGTAVSAVLPPENLVVVEPYLRRALRGEGVEFEAELPYSEKGTHTMHVVCIPDRDAQDHVRGLFVMSQDVTERNRAESALRESEAKFRALVEGSLQGLLLHADGIVVFANAAMARLFGFERADALVGLPIGDLVLARTEAQDGALVKPTVSAEQGSERYTAQAQRRDGQELWLEVSERPAEWEGTPATQITAVDITTRVDLEIQLRQSQKLEALGQLAGGVAHEFNNLLQVIRGYTELAMRGMDAESQGHSDLRQVQRATEKGKELTYHLLAYTRQQPLQIKPLVLEQELARVVTVLQPLLGEQIRVEQAPLVPLPQVLADSAMLEQVLMNLCINARDAMRGGGTLRLEASYLARLPEGATVQRPAQHGYVCIRVSDTGIGIPAVIRDKVFDPFFTTKEPGKGTGLGLSMVYGIVQQHAGAITVESREGHGSTFALYLPAFEALSPAATPAPSASERAVLIAEDNPDVRDFLRMELEGHGFRVLSAEDGETAQRLFLAEQEQIVAAVLDVGLPGMSGVELYRELRAAHATLPIVLCTGYGADPITGGVREDAATRILGKPYDFGALHAHLTALGVA